jgi:peptidoglycan/LPS O-acetylase OafA/YrhL
MRETSLGPRQRAAETASIGVVPSVVPAPLPGSARIPELDGIRGVAILLVLLWHYVALRLEPGAPGIMAPLWTLMQISWTGVDLFFVLSGFLIGGILLEHRDSPHYFKTFYVRRVCRIFPLYYLLVLTYFAIVASGATLGGSTGHWLMSRPKPFWSYALFAQNWVMAWDRIYGCNWLGITWSLAVEEQFYLLLPFLIRFVPPKRLLPVLLGGIALAPVTRLALLQWTTKGMDAGYLLMPCRADALLLGVLAAWALRSTALRWRLMQHRARLVWLLGVFATGVVFIACRWPNFVSRPMNSWGRTWFALFYVLLLMIPMLKRDGLLATVFRSSLLRRLGAISYGIYMIHQLVFGLTMILLFPQTPQYASGSALLLPVALSLVLTLLLAALLYRYLEKPLISIGQGLRY